MQNSQPQRLPVLDEEDLAELQLMQHTNLLLENLAEREKVTVTAILDGLYEVGSTRIINQKISVKALRGPLKGIARFSKPVFRIFAWRWFKNNCPQLITTWLYNQVRFGNNWPLLETDSDPNLIDVTPIREALPPIVEKQAEEILALRGRVAILTALVTLLIAAVCFNVIA